MRIALTAFPLICCAWVLCAQDVEPPKVEQLFNANDFPKGWFFHSAENGTKLTDTWTAQKAEDNDEVFLKCAGKPYGYIRTLVGYENYDFGLEWKYPSDPNGNSGILIHTGEPDKIWPKAIQVQLHRPKAGSVFPIGGAKTSNMLDVKDLPLVLNKWHTCVISCRDGNISVVINGKKVGGVTGCTPRKGTIALQSEGSEIHFRKIWLKKLK